MQKTCHIHRKLLNTVTQKVQGAVELSTKVVRDMVVFMSESEFDVFTNSTQQQHKSKQGCDNVGTRCHRFMPEFMHVVHG
jgi:hypothetical protein